MGRRILCFSVVLFYVLLSATLCFAHSGKTDGMGGHYDNSTGEYHFHEGHGPHHHTNGVCQYKPGKVVPTDKPNKYAKATAAPKKKQNTQTRKNTSEPSKDKGQSIGWVGTSAVGVSSFGVGVLVGRKKRK